MAEEKIIVCYGNSLTEGYGFSHEEAYPGVLQRLLNQEGYSYQVINAGVSGEISSEGLRRLPKYLDLDIDFFILELGINDGLRGMSIDKMEQNLQEIITKVQFSNPGVKVMVAGMQMPLNSSNYYINKFMGVYPALARNNNAVLIPFFLKDVMGVKSLNLPDGLHPNPAGYEIIGRNVFEILKPYLDLPQRQAI